MEGGGGEGFGLAPGPEIAHGCSGSWMNNNYVYSNTVTVVVGVDV